MWWYLLFEKIQHSICVLCMPHNRINFFFIFFSIFFHWNQTTSHNIGESFPHIICFGNSKPQLCCHYICCHPKKKSVCVIVQTNIWNQHLNVWNSSSQVVLLIKMYKRLHAKIHCVLTCAVFLRIAIFWCKKNDV